MKVFPVILSGGVGSRLWPLSREHYPKQCLNLTNSEMSLLQKTVMRVQGVDELMPPIVVCNEDHRFLIAQQLKGLGICNARIILEPVGRNTAPAIALAALDANYDDDALLLVLPADHVINDLDAFNLAFNSALEIAKKDSIVTFGIKPTRVETGYGYIKAGKENEVLEFVEKPNLKVASEYIASGNYLWNSGMFLFKASSYLFELKRTRIEIYEASKQAMEAKVTDLDFVRIDESKFTKCPSESVDYAVMEKSENVKVVPYDGDWSDIGAWDALYEFSEKDSCNNVSSGDVILEDCHNSLIRAESRLVATVGVDNLIIVETPDAVLVIDKNKSQEVKKIVDRIKVDGRQEHSFHTVVHRPWGTYETVDMGERYQVKRIVVNPKEKLSVQMHHHRAEHWVVVSGTAKVQNGDKQILLTENESTYIPIGVVHALENPGKIPLELIEVQSGGYLGEDDIVRFSDKYGRLE